MRFPSSLDSLWKRSTNPLPYDWWQLVCSAVLLNPTQVVEQNRGMRGDLQLFQLLLQRLRRIVHSFNAQYVAVVLRALSSLPPDHLRFVHESTSETLRKYLVVEAKRTSSPSLDVLEYSVSVSDSTARSVDGSNSTVDAADWRRWSSDFPESAPRFTGDIGDSMAVTQNTLDANMLSTTALLIDHGCSIISGADASSTAAAVVAACNLPLQNTRFFSEKAFEHLLAQIRDSVAHFNSHKPYISECIPGLERFEAICESAVTHGTGLLGMKYSKTTDARFESKAPSHGEALGTEKSVTDSVTRPVFPYSVEGVLLWQRCCAVDWPKVSI